MALRRDMLEHCLRVAREAAAVAGRIHLRYLNELQTQLNVEQKPDATPVTQADRESEAAIREILKRETPEFGILGEEYGAEGDPHNRWILDPLDGTKAFIRRLPNFACLIGLVVDGEVQVGVAHAPLLPATFYAARGLGAFRDGEQLRTSNVANLSQAGLSLSNDHKMARDPKQWAALQRVLAQVEYCRGYGDWWGHCLVAQGSLDVMIDPIVETYDVCPLAVIVEEAGGTFGSMRGERGIDHGHALSTNGPLQGALVELLRDAW